MQAAAAGGNGARPSSPGALSKSFKKNKSFGYSTSWLDSMERVTNQGSIHQNMVRPDQILAKERIQKLKPDGSWNDGVVILTADHLVFGIGHNEDVVDWIPLHEIIEVNIKKMDAARTINRRSSLKVPPTDGEEATPAPNLPRLASFAAKQKSLWTSQSKSFFGGSSGRLKSQDEEGIDLEVATVDEGFNSGRIYACRFMNIDVAHEFAEAVRTEVEKAAQKADTRNLIEYWQGRFRKLYHGNIMQGIVVFLILFNFVINIVQAQIFEPEFIVVDNKVVIQSPMPTNPEDEERLRQFERMDVALTLIFTIELLINAFGHWFADFVNDGWNLLDTAIVLLSLMGLGIDDIPGVSVLRVLRTFRVLRVVGRFESLRRIINSIIVSVVPVFNAFLIGLLCVLIFAIIGVETFKDRAPDTWGTFARAMNSLFVLCALQVWDSENLPAFREDRSIDWGVHIFLISFVMVVIWTIIQVFVAVLLDNFISATISDKKRKRLEKQKKARTVSHALGPLLEKLSNNYDTSDDLTGKHHQIFQVIDTDRMGALNFDSLREGLRKLDLQPGIHLSKDDFDTLTENGRFLSMDDDLDEANFDKAMRIQLECFIQRNLADALAMDHEQPHVLSVIAGMKLLLADREEERKIKRSDQDLNERAKNRMNNLESEVDCLKAEITTGFAAVRKAMAQARFSV